MMDNPTMGGEIPSTEDIAAWESEQKDSDSLAQDLRVLRTGNPQKGFNTRYNRN